VSGALSEADTELSPARVKELLDAGEAQLVDVRETYEWEAGRIEGAR
jgi:rhodanese-related sulfurtransferase